MPKTKSVFICSNCSFQSPRWQGRCPECGEWNTFSETQIAGGGKASARSSAATVQHLGDIEGKATPRLSTGIGELDSVLGGGIVPGSLVLLGGDPGIGKSTIALQLAINAQKSQHDVLYVSGEESAQQIKLRSNRLPVTENLAVLAETNLETVLATILAEQPEVVVIDSIQTMNSEQVNGVVGGVSQLTFATNALMRLAKENHIAIIVIGHVTKEGMLAGPKTLEHMVDTVLYLEGERFASLRILRSNKNRFGSVGEVGVFEMTEEGMMEVANPSLLFLENRETSLPGSATTAVLEGNKVLMLEIQALVNPSHFNNPRRTTSGFDLNRLQLILAILQKSLGLKLNEHDVFINVAGGFKIDERAADLPVALAILSSMTGLALPPQLVAFGEIGLLGEIRGVAQADKRIREVQKLGFKNAVVGGRKDDKLSAKFKGIDVQLVGGIRQLEELLKK
jgi:DNA repair protein RadA/Sms